MEKVKLCLVCSSGGHFQQLYSLKKFWSKYDRFWITFNSEDTRYLLNNEEKFFAYSPTNRNIKNLIRNSFLALKIIIREKPNFVISTGAGVCIPFFYVGKLLGAKVIYIESLTRVKELSLTGKVVYPVSDFFLVQHPELLKKYRKAIFKGRLI